MSYEIYPSDYSTRYEVSHAISAMSSVYYNEMGRLTLVMPIDEYNIRALKELNVVYDTARKIPYIIVNTKTETELNRITANGLTGDWLLNKRAVYPKRTINNVESDLYAAVNANLRGLTRIRTAPVKGLTKTLDDAEFYGGQLCDLATDVLSEVELGHRVGWDELKNEFVYEIYEGIDRTQGIHAVVFSEEQGTATGLVLNDDLSGMKNFAYIPVEYKDDATSVLTVGTASGDDRYEIWSDRLILQSFDETTDAVNKRAKAEAALELAQNIRRRNFSVQVDPTEIGTRYNVGDIVACVSIRFGVQFTARVSGVKYTMDITGEKTEVILGTPTLTAIGGLKLGKY